MAVEELLGTDESAEKRRAKWIGVYIALLAVLLAICSMGGGNAAKDAAKANLDATNLWAFFQAKNLRRTHYKMWSDDLERQLLEKPDMPDDAKALINRQIATYKEKIAVYTSDKKRNEGLDELFVRARAMETARDAALERDPYFDFGEAFLQIAIVMASVAIVAGGSLPLVLSLALGGIGTAFMVNGFLLLPGLTTLLTGLLSLFGI